MFSANFQSHSTPCLVIYLHIQRIKRKFHYQQNPKIFTTLNSAPARHVSVNMAKNQAYKRMLWKTFWWLDNTYNSIGFSKPNVDLEANISTISTEIKHFTQNDLVIMCDRTQNIGRNDSNLGLHSLTHFVFSTSNTNVIAVYAPHQFDLSTSLCVKKK